MSLIRDAKPSGMGGKLGMKRFLKGSTANSQATPKYFEHRGRTAAATRLRPGLPARWARGAGASAAPDPEALRPASSGGVRAHTPRKAPQSAKTRLGGLGATLGQDQGIGASWPFLGPHRGIAGGRRTERPRPPVADTPGSRSPLFGLDRGWGLEGCCGVGCLHVPNQPLLLFALRA
jgi:hypothetical protein